MSFGSYLFHTYFIQVLLLYASINTEVKEVESKEDRKNGGNTGPYYFNMFMGADIWIVYIP